MPKINLNKKQISILGLVVLSGISLLYLFYRANPQTSISEIEQVRQTVIENPKSDLAKIKAVQIDLADNYVIPEYPVELPVYGFSASPLNLLKETQILAQKIGLRKHPTLNNYWVNDTESQILYFDTKNNGIFYSRALDAPPVITVDPNKLNQFVNLAQQYAKDLFGPSLNTAVKSEISFLTGVDELTLSENRQAVRVLIPFVPTLNSYPLKVSALIKPPLTISVDVNNFISGFEYYPNTITIGTVLKKVPSQNKDKIKYLIQGGAGKISYLYSDFPIVTTIDSFDKIILDSSVVEYHTDSLRGQIIPYLNFAGNTSTAEHGDIKLNILLPLVVLD